MSSPLPTKRRKLNDANSKLHKPFISPMRTPKAERVPLQEDPNKANTTTRPYLPSTLAHTIKQPNTTTGRLANPASTKPDMNTPAKPTPARKQTPTLWSSKKKDPAEVAAQRAITSLELQIKKVQNDLDALKQAKQLSTTSTDAELEALSEKWRLTSQSVAEELFGEVKERVQRMGGVAAWREMEKRKHDRAHGMGDFAQEEQQEDDDADCEFDSQGEELPEEEQEYRKKMKRQAKKEMMDAADVPDEVEVDPNAQKSKVWQEEGKDDDTFTMDMMLRSLNIELGVIGYDKETQKWI
ncbi:uncharacterized protein CLAFUR5_12081 [Fulvia fulva]|uniref:Uncharacterized protein n=1 Tax=Passalora fulva TaxID=5499 RepID=A0A9Q8UUN1_PASFU|nr:uncharacterized protein CLAFUR5_12081 [Fulvia fulva]KAK4626219.1 hypothetical protein CLAFUR4_04808 [Fulvia fulva]KAK4628288.1 hypothetical protein CLAFUR0_04812 [Fulvia fulva]UJO23124.1 hypothetical protein CLAFUR5_12081 [Fulvia fulva]WPV28554.1 hypothetical protein CLAFUW7_04816 [Fulvia fulva]